MNKAASLVMRGAFMAACTAFVAVGGGIGEAQAPAGRADGARGGGAGGLGGVPLGDGPWEFGAGAARYRVTVITKALDHPWGIAFLPDGDLLVTERAGRLRVVRKGVLDHTPIGPLPAMAIEGLGGLLDVTLHPNFAQNRLIYLSYSKPGKTWGETVNGRRSQDATTAVYCAKWDGGSTLTDGKDIWVADAWHGGPDAPRGIGPATGSYGSRIVFDTDGMMFISLGDRNYPPASQDMNSHIGKIVRLRDDGSVPPDNPFVGKAGVKPEIWTSGHRNPLGLYIHPVTQALWSTEEGPQGGDELNLIEKGKNYGWPLASLGRNYDGTIVGNGFTAPGIVDPVVYWTPAIAVSGLSFYNGDKFPAWKGNAFVGAMRAGTGQFVARVVFNQRGLPIGRDHSILAELRQRIREVKPGTDGLIYVLTDETAGAILRIEPPTVPTQPASIHQALASGGGWPIIDGYVIPEDLSITFGRGRQNAVDVIVGFNKDEQTAFGGADNTNTRLRDAMAWHMRLFAERQTAIGRKAYFYTFTHEPPHEPIMNQVRTVTDKPVSMIVNTHSHPDHIGSNEYFPASVEVVTHETTRKWMAANPRVASNPAAMPDRTFTDRMTLGSGDHRFDLYYFGAGHTDGDAFIVFPARRAMAAGDVFAWKMSPLIDPMAGGSVLALPATLEKAVSGIPNVDYGGTPLSRAVINVNVAFQELGKR